MMLLRICITHSETYLAKDLAGACEVQAAYPHGLCPCSSLVCRGKVRERDNHTSRLDTDARQTTHQKLPSSSPGLQYICLHKARKGKMVDLLSFQLSSFAFTVLWSTTSIRFQRWVGLSKYDHKLPFIHVPRLGIIFIPRVTERMYRHVMMIYPGFFRNTKSILSCSSSIFFASQPPFFSREH